MSTSSFDLRELVELIEAVRDGRIIAEQLARLEEILGGHQDARRYYRRAMRLHGYLEQNAVAVATPIPPAAQGLVAADTPPVRPAASPARTARRRFIAVLVTLAAGLLIAVGLWSWWPGVQYAAPTLEGDFSIHSASGEVVGQRIPQRGDTIIAGDSDAELSIGAYCSVTLKPGTELVLKGNPRSEVLELKEGTVESRIVPEKGRFRIDTPLGHVSVRGTEFITTVEYKTANNEGVQGINGLKKSAIVTVAVVSGMVAFEMGGMTGILGPGSSQAFADDNEKTESRAEAALPSPWQNQDIGAVGKTGSADHSNGTFTVKGGGEDIWSAKAPRKPYADQFHFAYQRLSGDGQISARVVSMKGGDRFWAKAGVMIRETLDPGSKNVAMLLTPADPNARSNGMQFQHRAETGGKSSTTDGGKYSPPGWVMVVRSGDTFTGYKSLDGKSWTTVGSHTVTMATDVYIGLAVTAHDNELLATGEFDNLATGPRGSPKR